MNHLTKMVLVAVFSVFGSSFWADDAVARSKEDSAQENAEESEQEKEKWDVDGDHGGPQHQGGHSRHQDEGGHQGQPALIMQTMGSTHGRS